MEKRKRKNTGFLGDIKKLIEERDRFYKGLEEIKTLEQSIDRLRKENEEKVKAFDLEFDSSIVTGSYSRLIGDKYPGREVFFQENRCQCFNTDKIMKIKLKDGSGYQQLRMYLEGRLDVTGLIEEEALVHLYVLMVVDSNELLVQSCHEVLTNNIKHFIPSFRHIIKALLNWGATCESLHITAFERNHLFPKGIRMKTKDPSKKFHMLNYSSLLDYVGEICKRHPDCYTKTEKAIMLKCLLRISMDESLSDVMISISSCISNIVESFATWDNFTVTNLCRLIHNEKENYHNQVAIVTLVLPKIGRCRDLSSCLSYNIFNSLMQSKSKYEFPYEDEEFVQLVNTIEVDPENPDDLHRLYFLMQLLNFIVYRRDLLSKPTILMEITDKLKQLEWSISKSTKIFDAAFVKARISYCCAMWSLANAAEQSNCE